MYKVSNNFEDFGTVPPTIGGGTSSEKKILLQLTVALDDCNSQM